MDQINVEGALKTYTSEEEDERSTESDGASGNRGALAAVSATCYETQALQAMVSHSLFNDPFRRRGRRHRRTHGIIFFLIVGLHFPSICTASSITSYNHDIYQYNICNGLSNQLLYHSASIAIAIEQDKAVVEVPDHFIVNGVQTTAEDVLPSATNSIPFGAAFDADHFQEQVQGLDIKVVFKTFDFSTRQLPCTGMQSLRLANPQLTLKILESFRPAAKLAQYIANITAAFPGPPDRGICVHHRDGQDWRDHCHRWSRIPDGLYRGNCIGVPGYSFAESLATRGPAPVAGTEDRFVYYCGDSDRVPYELRTNNNFTTHMRHSLMTDRDRAAVEALVPDPQNMRDIWALIDFGVCSELKHFVGNSVSTFSAIQIAKRRSNFAYWYNAQSIPLGHLWDIYQIPIVYTYTETSQSSGKHLLQASIVSIRHHMPQNTIHILYHGSSDVDFRQWLAEKDVIVHQHDPAWRDQIELMRRNGDARSSHLFLHAGNYFGTWQRIDIPLFVESEYCLLLDADTIAVRSFTLKDFGLDMTYSIAMSAEIQPGNQPSNAGVTLMNVPRMRETYNAFLEFILQHVHSARFNHPSPSDQGAYLEFYKHEVRFLSRLFNFKPYWQEKDIGYQAPFIIHFHGAKPHDYLRHIMGGTCPEAISAICKNSMIGPSLCYSLQVFARSSKAVDSVAYCVGSFTSSAEAQFCIAVLDTLAAHRDECMDLKVIVWDLLEQLPDSLGLEKAQIRRNLQLTFPRWSWGLEKVPCRRRRSSPETPITNNTRRINQKSFELVESTTTGSGLASPDQIRRRRLQSAPEGFTTRSHCLASIVHLTGTMPTNSKELIERKQDSQHDAYLLHGKEQEWQSIKHNPGSQRRLNLMSLLLPWTVIAVALLARSYKKRERPKTSRYIS